MGIAIGAATGATPLGPLASDQRRSSHGERLAAAEQRRSLAVARQIAELRQIDQRVRAHELAHIVAGDGVVRGGARYQYTVGPDGQRYAVGGEVPIDTSPGRTPEETLEKAQAIRRAALAPADPSPTDRRVAAQAAAMEAAARAEIRQADAARAREGEGPGAARDGPLTAQGESAARFYRAVAADQGPRQRHFAVA